MIRKLFKYLGILLLVLIVAIFGVLLFVDFDAVFNQDSDAPPDPPYIVGIPTVR
jgi:hypothetical protein